MSDTVFNALAHPERRRILQSLLRGSRPAMTLSSNLSASALSQHLAVLKAAGVVTEHRHGRNRIYSLDPKPLTEAYAWLAQYEIFWKAKMSRLGKHLEETHGIQRKKD